MMASVGKGVSFNYPEGQKKGILKNRVIVPSNPGITGVPYWDVVDLIEFSEESEPNWIRIGYYRKPKNRLVWGSQTTITEPVTVWKSILLQAAKEKTWFRDILEEVVEEIKK